MVSYGIPGNGWWIKGCESEDGGDQGGQSCGCSAPGLESSVGGWSEGNSVKL